MEKKSILSSRKTLIAICITVIAVAMLAVSVSITGYNNHLKRLTNEVKWKWGNLIHIYKERFHLATFSSIYYVTKYTNDTELLDAIYQFSNLTTQLGKDCLRFKAPDFVHRSVYFEFGEMAGEEQMNFINQTYSEINNILNRVCNALRNYPYPLTYSEILYFDEFYNNVDNTLDDRVDAENAYRSAVWDYNAAYGLFPWLAEYLGFHPIEIKELRPY